LRASAHVGATLFDSYHWKETPAEFHRPPVLTTPATRAAELRHERHGAAPVEMGGFVHGETVGVNNAIQRDGAQLALIGAGFEEVVDIARLRVPESAPARSGSSRTSTASWLTTAVRRLCAA
jgi:N-methylhydantoinase A